VLVSGILGAGLDHGTLEDAECPSESTWVELALDSQQNKEKLRKLLDRSRRAYVVVEDEFYGPPLPDAKLPEAIRKSYHPGWGNLAAFKTKLVVSSIRDVKPSPAERPVARTEISRNSNQSGPPGYLRAFTDRNVELKPNVKPKTRVCEPKLGHPPRLDSALTAFEVVSSHRAVLSANFNLQRVPAREAAKSSSRRKSRRLSVNGPMFAP
jgi:hypothetical protein